MKPFSCQLTNEINLIRILGVHGHVHPILFIFTLYKLGFRIEALALTGYQMYLQIKMILMRSKERKNLHSQF